ncbi:MAG: iron-containing alcohol dehydrogenase, partial [Kiritimatiellaceae bacterium]|nr:iron-containing alcohol dehydrogenase [Kiritimatiellaceae bacterium]
SPEHRVKVSIRHPLMIPDLAIIDPECTLSMPPAITAATGLDAFTQLLEAFLCKKPNPMTDGFCRDGLVRVVRSLRRAYANGSDRNAREDMALASLFGGLALANAGLGSVHGLAGPLGGMFDAPHGMVCASLLPSAMRVNLALLQTRSPESIALERLFEFARWTGGNTAEEGIEWISTLCRDLQVPRLASFGVTEQDFPVLAENAQRTSSIKVNPVALTASELEQVLRGAL